MMKRFIYDAVLIFMLLMIGVSLNDTKPYENTQYEMEKFEEDIYVEKEKSGVVNQIKDNKAGSFALYISNIFAFVFKSGILFLNSIFEEITKV